MMLSSAGIRMTAGRSCASVPTIFAVTSLSLWKRTDLSAPLIDDVRAGEDVALRVDDDARADTRALRSPGGIWPKYWSK